MPHAPAERGSAAIANAVELRLLWHTVHVTAPDDVLVLLDALLPQAEHPMPAIRSMHYEARQTKAGFEILEEGDALTTARTPSEATDAVYVRAHRRAFELASLAGWARVHAATIDLDGSRVLLVGPSGVGKTTLTVRLLFDGADVQGDESVLARAGASLAVPRAIHLKAGAEAFVPELAPLLEHLPRAGDVMVLDPSAIGRPWRLVERRIDHVVLLERGGPVACTPAGGGAVLEALVRDAFPLTETKAALVTTVVEAISSARGHRLTIGDPVEMVGGHSARGALASGSRGRPLGTRERGADTCGDTARPTRASMRRSRV